MIWMSFASMSVGHLTGNVKVIQEVPLILPSRWSYLGGNPLGWLLV